MTREEAKAYIIRHCNPDYPKGKTEWERAVNTAIKALEQPEIIRCPDCKYADEYNQCDRMYVWNSADDFCSRAERKEE